MNFIDKAKSELFKSQLKVGDMLIANDVKNYIYFKHLSLYRVEEKDGVLGVYTKLFVPDFYPLEAVDIPINGTVWRTEYSYSESHDMHYSYVYFTRK